MPLTLRSDPCVEFLLQFPAEPVVPIADASGPSEHLDPLLDAETLALFVASVRDYGIFMLDVDGCIASWNPGAERIKGYRAEDVIGRHFSIFYPPDDIAAGKPAEELRIARAQGKYEEAGWRLRKDGSRFLAHVVITAVVDDAGRLLGFGKVTQDVTERQRAEERQQILIDELNHRVKNTLATVQSFVRQTLRHPASGADRESLEDRLMALSRTHDLLTARKWESGSLTTVVQDGLAPFAPTENQVRLSGPDLPVSSNAALALGMAVFELATNATKHGALATPLGRVDLAWRLDASRFVLEWRERGGPAVPPPTNGGFGRRLLTAGLPRQLDGDASLTFEPSGVDYVLSAPAAALGR